MEGSEVEIDELIHLESKIDASETSPVSTTGVNAEAETPIDRLEVTLPMGDHTGLTLRNLVNMVASKQNLSQQSLGFSSILIS